MRRFGISLLLLIFMLSGSYSQSILTPSRFSNVLIKVDTVTYSTQNNLIRVGNADYLYFKYAYDDAVCEVNLFPSASSKGGNIRLLESGDYTLVDSLINMNNEYWQFKVRFKNLTKSQFLKFTFGIKTSVDTAEVLETVNLFPYTETKVTYYPESDELFIGEEKVYELVANHPGNILVTNEWTSGLDIDYRITEKFGQLQLHLLPHNLGRHTAIVKLQTIKPFLDENHKAIYSLPELDKDFTVKASRLVFLNIDKKEVTMDEKTRMEGVEIQMDDNRALVLNKTYRVEDSEEPGGALIAEIFTKTNLTNNRVLCILRPYNYHRNSQGYLYIKDGDNARFITNVSITPKTTITKVSLMHEGEDWTDNLTIHPGETVNVKIEGEGLHKAKFLFEDAIDLTSDTLLHNENLALFKIKIPVNISKKRLSIFNNSERTGIELNVREYQVPRPLDYVYINYGDIDRNVATLKSPIIYGEGVKDIEFSFIPRRIDEDELHGKQYLKVDVKITDSKNQLVDMKTIDNIVVCPGDNSPRYSFYDHKDCAKDEISLNDYLSKKTYELNDWAKIEVNVENKNDKDISKKFDLVLQKKYKFDLDVSFPSGLVTMQRKAIKDTATDKVVGHEWSYGGLSGISMAILAQFSFYEPDKVARLKPYRFSAGFIAMNAFNFSESADRDVGFVVLGSIYPTKTTAKIQIPLHFGAGYLMKAQNFYFLLGPGFQFNW